MQTKYVTALLSDAKSIHSYRNLRDLKWTIFSQISRRRWINHVNEWTQSEWKWRTNLATQWHIKVIALQVGRSISCGTFCIFPVREQVPSRLCASTWVPLNNTTDQPLLLGFGRDRCSINRDFTKKMFCRLFVVWSQVPTLILNLALSTCLTLSSPSWRIVCETCGQPRCCPYHRRGFYQPGNNWNNYLFENGQNNLGLLLFTETKQRQMKPWRDVITLDACVRDWPNGETNFVFSHRNLILA
jgi:hypothetical protein